MKDTNPMTKTTIPQTSRQHLIITNGIKKKKTIISDLQGISELLQNSSGQSVSVQSQGLQVRQSSQRREELEESLVGQLGEAQLQADQVGRVTLQVCRQTLHVASR